MHTDGAHSAQMAQHGQAATKPTCVRVGQLLSHKAKPLAAHAVPHTILLHN